MWEKAECGSGCRLMSDNGILEHGALIAFKAERCTTANPWVMLSLKSHPHPRFQSLEMLVLPLFSGEWVLFHYH